MKTLMTPRSIEELRNVLSKEIEPNTVEKMSDEEISFIGFFLLEVFRQGFRIRK